MSKIQDVQKAMMDALKAKETQRKEALSLLLSALKAQAKDQKEPLTQEQEDRIIARELKQTRETMQSAPKDRSDIRAECEFRLSVLSEFAPAAMGEAEIRAEIQKVLTELGIEQPTGKDKGRIMKLLMPRVKDKADGFLVNETLTGILQP